MAPGGEAAFGRWWIRTAGVRRLLASSVLSSSVRDDSLSLGSSASLRALRNGQASKTPALQPSFSYMNTHSPNKSLKTLLNFLALTVLLVVASSQCFAFVELVDVSKEQAKELGVIIRSQRSGDTGVAV
jgi:hypothetical protein